MADVSVEFGAKDTGLEATLKTVQAEMSRLETEIKSGELSFNQLSTAMRDLAKADKVSQQLQAIGGAAAGASPQVDKLGKDGKEMGDNVKKGSDKGGMSLGELAKASGVAGAAFSAGMAVFNTAMKGVQAVAASFGNALDLGGRLDDLSIQTGIAAGELLVLERAFQNSGAGADKVSTTISKVASAIVDATSGSGAASASFDRLGLSASELINLPADKQFEKISSALSGVANQTERSALANDIFGQKLAKDLLPLISDFGGEINKAGGQLGSLPGIMNGAAKSFADIGDGIKVAQGKLTEFAAGLLSVMTPAIDAVVTALTRINAAQIGKDLGSAFVGAGEAMKGFQSAVDAFQAGNISLALKSIFESVKLQAMETGNSIINIFSAAFQTAGAVIRALFSQDSATMKFIDSAFFIAGQKAAMAFASAMLSVLPNMKMFDGVRANLESNLEKMDQAQYNNFRKFKQYGTDAAAEVGNVLSQAPSAFKANLAAANGEFFKTEEQAKKLKAVQEEINTATGKHPALIKDAAQEMRDLIEAQKASTQAETKKLEAAADIAEAKMRDVEMQIQLNDAIATGNTAEQARLEAIIEAEKGTERIKTLTEEYAKVMPADEAERLANEIYRSEANMLAAKKATTDTKTEVGTLGNLLAGITEVKVEDPIKKFKEESKQAQTELKGISKILNVDITGGSPVDMMKKLGLDPNAITGSQNQLDAIKGAIDILKGADPADLTPKVDKVGVQDNIDAIQTYIQTKLGGTTTANIEATADKNAADNAAGAIKDKVGSINSQITTQTDDNNIASTRATIEQGVAGIPLTFTVDPEQIKKSIGTINLSGGAGGGVLSSIETLVSTIQGYVETIRDRLPITALA
jgi:hypothetical protein